jgi:ferredoxin/flavodoxin---NADP+ reductase
MHKIVHAEFIAPDIKRFRIEAPKIAQKRKPGQFVVIRIKDKAERIPLTIVDSDPIEGTVTLVVQGIGKGTKELNALNSGDLIENIVGPLGKGSEIEKYGTVVVVGGGVGTGVAYPTAKALKDAGNFTISIVGARSQNLIVLEKEMKDISDESYVTTDDGSYGFHGFVTNKLQEIIDSGRKIDLVLAIGPLPMMKAVSALTQKYGIHTTVSLNPIMVDGIGMCGGCRATVDNKTVFVCVDGPEFDAHKVDFNVLMMRNKGYIEEEKASLQQHLCRMDQAMEESLKQP